MIEEFDLAGQKWKFDSSLYVWRLNKWEYVGYSDLVELTHTDAEWMFEIDDDYQGDYFAAGHREDGKWLFIQGSFGSCSGCDWLQGLSDLEDAKKIINYHSNEVIVKETKEEILAYMQDTTKNVSWSKDTLEKLIAKVQTVVDDSTKKVKE